MEFSYVAYGRDKKLVKGRLVATSEALAIKQLNYGGFQVLQVKPISPLINFEKINDAFNNIKPKEVTMFSRQLALLLESGTDIVASLELLAEQITNKSFRKVIAAIVADIRGGSSLSAAMKKHPRVFPAIYARAIAAGERGGNLEVVLRQMSTFIERKILTEKRIKNALSYPVIVVIVAILVVAVLVAFVLPAFTTLYSSFGSDLPLATQIFLDVSNWLIDYGLYRCGRGDG